MADKTNIKYKDSIFRYLFKEPENFSHLYKYISGEDVKPDDLIFKDTSSILLVKEYQNDVSFLTKDNRFIYMCEHQSSLNENMALRSLIYYVELLKIFIKENSIDLHGEKKVYIPSGEFYVAYNGTKKLNDDFLELKSNFSDKHNNINLKVNIININYDNINNIENKNSLVGYSYFIECIRKYEKIEDDKIKVFELAKQDCIENGFLVDYMNRKEFLTMAKEYYSVEKQVESAKIYAFERGEKKEKISTVKNCLKNNLSIDLISRITGLSEEEILKIKEELENQSGEENN